MAGEGGAAAGWIGRAALLAAHGGGVVLLAMTALTFLDVAGRAALNRPIVGSVEILTMMMGLLLFAGVGRTTLRGGHVRVDVLTRLLPPAPRAALDAAVHLLSLLVSVVVCWRLWAQALEHVAETSVTQNLELPIWAVALAVAALSPMLVAGMAVRTADALRSARRRKGAA